MVFRFGSNDCAYYNSEILSPSNQNCMNIKVTSVVILLFIHLPFFADVVWFRGSTWNLMEDTEQYDVEISQSKECHFITLFNVNTSHSGTYSCMAVNAKQEIWHEFVLNVDSSKT